MSQNAHKSGLTAKQQRAIESLLDGQTKGQAAIAAGVIPRTLSRWLADDAFRAELTARSDMAVKDAAGRLKVTLDAAVTVIQTIMADESISPVVRLRAADMAATHAVKLVEIADLIKRIEALEGQRYNER